MSEQIRGPDGRYLSSDIIGDDVPPTVWVNKTESVLGATAETPAPSDLSGKFNAADVNSAARDAAEKTKAASRLKSQLEQLEEDARAFGINAGDGSPSPRQEPIFFEKSISQLRQSIEEMSKEMKLLSPDSRDGHNQLDAEELELAQSKMLAVMRDVDDKSMDDRAWHQLRPRFSVKDMQDSVQN